MHKYYQLLVLLFSCSFCFELPLYFDGVNYNLRLKVGSNQQRVDLVFDLASGKTMVNSVNCSSCRNRFKYNQKQSSSFQQNSQEIKKYGFVDGLTESIVGSDLVYFKDDVAMRIKLSVIIKTGQFMQNIPGIYGAYKQIDKDGNIHFQANLLKKMKEKGQIDRKVIGIYLTNSKQQSRVMFGSINHIYYKGEIKYKQFNRHQKFYGTRIGYIQIGNQIHKLNQRHNDNSDEYKSNSILDSGNTSFTITKQILAFIQTHFKRMFNIETVREKQDNDNYFSVIFRFHVHKSKYFPDLKIEINGLKLTLKPIQYIETCERKVENDQEYYDCESIFECQHKFGGFITIGSQLMRSIYVVLDYEQHRLGIAQSRFIVHPKLNADLELLKSKAIK